jgi:uncharacterized protein YjbI with pentapeptide repeats
MLVWVAACILGPVVVVGLAILLLGPVSSLIAGPVVHDLEGREEVVAINAVRQLLLQTIAGSAGLIVVVFTARTYLLNRRGQVTDRYAKAIGMLASDKLDERIGGVYALEHVMIESERDHETVVQVLAAFVREHAPAPTATTSGPPAGAWRDHSSAGAPSPPETNEPTEPAADIQAAVTVIGRRPQREEIRGLDLRRIDLRGADLSGARLEHADLRKSHFKNANLIGAHLRRANLIDAHLEHAYLRGAHLEDASLLWAFLGYADMRMAHLENAELSGARLERANLSGAHLEHADLITAHLEHANLSKAHLEHAALNGAHLERADLSEAHLERADLSGARLEHTNLSGAHLEHAMLRDTNLEGANLHAAKGL